PSAEVFVHHHQPSGVAKRQRPQQHRTHHGEKRGGRADAKSHHHNRNDRESGSAEKAADTKAQIAKEPSPPPCSAAFPAILFDLLDAAELETHAPAGFAVRKAGPHLLGNLSLE